VFVDDDRRAVDAITRNLSEIGADGEVTRRDALAFLAGAAARFDLVFLDPPYSSAPQLAARLTERLPAVLTDDARIVTESDKRTPLELELPLVTERDYGHTRIRIHRGP
jgi:16S rRNA G966 N2-methylase RsmD